jgi:hypothetical protein
MSNRHPVDRLADVRAEMRELKEREEKLRNEILEGERGECDLSGDEFEACIVHSEQERVSIDAIRRKMGREWMKEFVRSSSIVSIRLKKREALEDAYQD